MESGKIPVLSDIVERGKHAPEKNMQGQQQANAGSEEPTIMPESVTTNPLPSDLDITAERPVIPEELLNSYARREQLVDQVMLELMPQLEAVARDTIERILAESERTDDS
jgi:hypothetical protein